MVIRLLMLSPVFTEDALPEVVREDVAEACAYIEYEMPEELVAKMLEAVTQLAEKVAAKPEAG